METDYEKPNQPEQNQLKLYAYVLVACLAIVAALVMNGIGGSTGSPSPPANSQASGGPPAIKVPQLPGLPTGGLLGVPNSVQKAGDLVDQTINVGGQAVDVAETAVEAGGQVIGAGAQLVDDFLGGGTTGTSSPPSNPNSP